MKRIRLKKRRKLSHWNYIVIVITVIIISIIWLLNFLGKKATPIIMNYAEKQAKKIATIVISQSVNEEVISSFKTDDLFVTNSNDKGEISSVDFNPLMVNKMLASISSNVKSYLKKLESGQIGDLGLSDTTLVNVSSKELKNGVIYEVPSGIIFNNGLLANIGPKIPVKLSLIGDITTDVKTKISDYGINNAIIEIVVNVKVTEQVILPFDYKQITVETDIPIAMKMIQGKVPNYYFNGKDVPSLSIDAN